MNTLKKLFQPNERAFKYRCLLLLLMVLFSMNIMHAQRNIFVDLDTSSTSGVGTETSPYSSINDAVYQANAEPSNWFTEPWIIDGASQVDVNIYIKGTTQGPVFMTFGERKDSTFIHILPWPGEENFVIDNQNNTVGSNFGLSVTLNKFADFSISGLTLTGGYYENYGVYINVLNTNQPTVKIENSLFDTISWTTDNSLAMYPPNSNSYLYPLYFNAQSNQQIEISNNTFHQVAVGYGKLAGATNNITSLNNFNSHVPLGTDDNGNSFHSILYPWTATTATEFYVDASVPAGTSGYGGVGSEVDPWKYLTSANFGAIFNDWSTNPPTKVDKDVTIYFEAGTHVLQNSIYMSDISAESSVTLKPAPGAEGSVILDGSGISGQWESMIACANCNNVTIEGLILKNLTCNQSYDMDTRFGIIFSGSGSNISITDNTITEMHWSNNANDRLNPDPTNNLGAIQILGTQSTPITNVIISNNTVSDITPGWTEAITINGNVNGFAITGNTVSDIKNIGIVAAGNYGWVVEQTGATVTAANNFARNGVISDNTVTTCLSPIAASAGIYLDGSQNVEVSNNTSSHNGVGMSVGNEVYNSSSGGHTIHDNTFANNLLAGMYIGSTSPGSNVDDVEVYSNTTNNNFNLDPAYLALANGNYGGDTWFDIEITQVTNLKFYNNEINPNSNYILNKRYAETHTGHDYYDNIYTMPSSHADLQPTFRDETTANVATLYDWESHKARGLDHVGSVLVGSTFAGVDLLKDDLEFLDPYDDDGNKWFETAQDKTDFLNAILTATGTTEDTAPASIKNDIFVASVRSDDDREYDNKNYHTLVLVKSNTLQTVFDDLIHNYTDRHVYTIQFYVGENMTTAKYNLDEDVPAGNWGEELINSPTEFTFTSTEQDAPRNTWLELEVDFNSIMNSLTLWGQ